MQPPVIPEYESLRQQALDELDLLDTHTEERFDRLTGLAARIFDVPIALVSLVDRDRQWFKSKQGLDACETAREISFCGHAILNDEIFYIPDAAADPRFADNPLVSGPPHIRTYAGAPLKLRNGYRVGTLCIISDTPRTFGPDELGQLRDLADIAQSELELMSLVDALQTIAEKEEQISQIVDSVVDGIVTVDTRGMVETFNPAAEKIFGYRKDEVIGRHANTFVPEYECFENRELSGCFGRGGETIGIRRDGSRFPMELAVSVMKTKDGFSYTGIMRDITERKRAAVQLLESKKSAEAANIAKSRFLAGMSHELRTPLNAIIGYSELMMEEAAALDQDEFTDDLLRVRDAGRHLLGLINDILDLSKIEAGKVGLYVERIAVADLIESVVRTTQTLVDKNGNRFDIVGIDEELGDITSDITRIRQVLFNLLSNAAKFTDQGVVTLSAKRESIDGLDWLEFEVSDTGCGMTEAQLAHVFDEFAQAEDSTASRFGGTGLGMPISRKLCQLLRGKIDVRSAPGKGTTCTVRLPAEMDQDERELAASSAG